MAKSAPPVARLIDFTTKKSVHINLTTGAHAALKIACFKRSLSIQEVFEEFAQLVGQEKSDAVSILEDLALRKRNKVIKQLSAEDADSIFDLIELDNPLSRSES